MGARGEAASGVGGVESRKSLQGSESPALTLPPAIHEGLRDVVLHRGSSRSTMGKGLQALENVEDFPVALRMEDLEEFPTVSVTVLRESHGPPQWFPGFLILGLEQLQKPGVVERHCDPQR